MYNINELPKVIEIGRREEGKVTTLIFDLRPWTTAWPEGVIMASYKAPGTVEVYTLGSDICKVEDDIVTITVTKTMTPKAGEGRLEFRLVDDNGFEKRSDTVKLKIDNSLTPGTLSKPPTIVEGWLTSAQNLLNRVDQQSDALYDAVSAAKVSANKAGRYYSSLIGIELEVDVVNGTLNLYSAGNSPIDIELNDRSLEVWGA